MHGENKVYFLLDSSINCGWLKCLGAPTEERLANLRIYFVGGYLPAFHWAWLAADLMPMKKHTSELLNSYTIAYLLHFDNHV